MLNETEVWYQGNGPSKYWYSKGRSNGTVAHVKASCDVCHVEYFQRVFRKESKYEKYFCSRGCARKYVIQFQDTSHLKKHEFKKGQPPHNYIGRTKHSAGYIVRTGNKKIQLEHRMLVEQFLGRELTKDEIVHHINGDVTDNRLENLRIMTQSEHCKIHQQEQMESDPIGYIEKRKRASNSRWR